MAAAITVKATTFIAFTIYPHDLALRVAISSLSRPDDNFYLIQYRILEKVASQKLRARFALFRSYCAFRNRVKGLPEFVVLME